MYDVNTTICLVCLSSKKMAKFLWLLLVVVLICPAYGYGVKAWDLEKAKEYTQAKDIYLDLSTRFPASIHYEEAVFKTAMIYTYVLRDIEKGRSYFKDLADKEKITPAVISSLYQLGLLAQWQKDLSTAKGYYDSLLDRAGRAFGDRRALTKIRLKEIAQAKPLEYNLKKFLDVSLNKENFIFSMSK